jgi:hypothetical protein
MRPQQLHRLGERQYSLLTHKYINLNVGRSERDQVNQRKPT